MIKRLLFLINILFLFSSLKAQTPATYQPYSFQFYQKFDKYIYDKDVKFHTALKPYFYDDSLLKAPLDSFYNQQVKIQFRSSFVSWVGRKVFNEHLINVKGNNFTFYGDFLPDYSIGRELEANKTTWLDSKAFQFGGTIGSKFSFYTSAFENQGEFPAYLQKYIEDNKVVPGQGLSNSYVGKPKNKKDYSYVTALISYTPNKYVNFTLGQDKIFIGDGYRSMILSDYATNYPFFKVTANLGNVQYSAIWAAMQEPKANKFSYDTGYRKKGAVFHYLDWNVNKRLSIGLFDAIIWAGKDDLGNTRGFDYTYINPIIFLRPLERNNGSPDNALVGFTSKYKVLKKTTIYGQFILDELEAKNFFSGSGSVRNKWGAQLGFRGSDLLNVQNLNYLLEYNLARPFTYDSRSFNDLQTTVIGNYGHYSEPLAHPFGANFKEVVSILNYNYKRLGLFGKINVGKYGYDLNGDYYGKSIFKPYSAAVDFTPNDSQNNGHRIGQGLKTDLLYLDGRISYLINPKFNLRVELGGVMRSEKNSLANNQTKWVTFGIRSSFRNLYYDF